MNIWRWRQSCQHWRRQLKRARRMRQDARARRFRRVITEMLEPRRLLSVDFVAQQLDADILSAAGAAHFSQLPDGLEIRVANLAEDDPRLDLDEHQILLLSTGPHPGYLRIDAADNENAADSQNSDQVRSGGSAELSLDGNGLTVGVWEARSGACR